MIRRNDCPVCTSDRITVFYRADYSERALVDYLSRMYPRAELDRLAGEVYELAECRECSFIFQLNIPDSQLMHQLYETWIDSAAARAFDERRTANVYGDQCAELTVLLSSLGPPSQLSVLDFGMGWGNWCMLAQGFGCQAAGIELARSRLAHAARFGVHPPGQGQQFQLVHADQVLEHVAHPRAELRKLADRLGAGGALHVTVPDCRSLKRRLRRCDWSAPIGSKRSLQMAAPLEHINCFTYRSLDRLAQETGLQVDRIRTTEVIKATRRGIRRLRSPLRTNLVFAKSA